MAFVNSLSPDHLAIARSVIKEAAKSAWPLVNLDGARDVGVTASGHVKKFVARWSTRVLLPVLAAGARVYTNLSLPRIDALTDQFNRNAMVLERSQELLIEEMVLTGKACVDSLVGPVDELVIVKQKRVAQFDRMIADLHEMNPHSRLAMGYMRLRAAFERLGAAAEGIKVVCQPGDHALAVFSRVHALQANIDAKVTSYFDDEEFDPELAALADRALARIAEDAKYSQRS